MSLNIFRESIKIIFRFIGITVSSCMSGQNIFFVRNNYWITSIRLCLLNICKHFSICQQTFFCIFRISLFDVNNELGWIHTISHTDKLLHSLVIHTAFFTLEFCNNLVNLSLYYILVFHFFQAIQKLCKSSSRISHDRLHSIYRFQRIINTNRIINFKMSFMNLRTQSGSSSHHLFKEDTRFYSAHEYQCCNFRYINTSCK